MAVSTVESPKYEAFAQARFEIVKDGDTIAFKRASGLNRTEDALFKYDLSDRDLTIWEKLGLLV